LLSLLASKTISVKCHSEIGVKSIFLLSLSLNFLFGGLRNAADLSADVRTEALMSMKVDSTPNNGHCITMQGIVIL